MDVLANTSLRSIISKDVRPRPNGCYSEKEEEKKKAYNKKFGTRAAKQRGGQGVPKVYPGADTRRRHASKW